jgi:uncharacterized protein YpmS
MRLLVFFIKLFFFLFLLVPLLIASLLVFSLQDTSLVTEKKPLTPQEIHRVNAFINDNNPVHFKANEKRATAISEADTNLLARYMLKRFDERIQAEVVLSDQSAQVTGTVSLPHNPIGDFINVSTSIKQQGESIEVEQLTIGDIHIPRIIANVLLIRVHNILQKKFPEYITAMNSLESFQLSQQKLAIRYVWQAEAREQLKSRLASTLIEENLQQPITIYTQALIESSQSVRQARPTLTALLQPLFKLAVKRSQHHNPVNENRALFIALGAYMLNRNMVGLWDKQTHPLLKRKRFYLRNREDLSRHFLVSAAITALSGSKLAQFIGVDKELSDSMGGSGFSFADLAADRAGIMLAKRALHSKEQAHSIQQRLAKTTQSHDFMPAINHLPEGLEAVDFKALYTDTNSTTYQQVVQVIDERITACKLYR